MYKLRMRSIRHPICIHKYMKPVKGASYLKELCRGLVKYIGEERESLLSEKICNHLFAFGSFF